MLLGMRKRLQALLCKLNIHLVASHDEDTVRLDARTCGGQRDCSLFDRRGGMRRQMRMLKKAGQQVGREKKKLKQIIACLAQKKKYSYRRRRTFAARYYQTVAAVKGRRFLSGRKTKLSASPPWKAKIGHAPEIHPSRGWHTSSTSRSLSPCPSVQVLCRSAAIPAFFSFDGRLLVVHSVSFASS